MSACTGRQRAFWSSPRFLGGALTALLLGWSIYCVAGAAQQPPPGGQPPPTETAGAPAEMPPSSGRDSPGPDATFVGSAICGAPACHGGQSEEFDRLRHSHFVSNVKYGMAAGCEICHGPASNHVLDPEHRRIWRFTIQNWENAHRINEACLRCHQETIQKPHFNASQHERAGLSCATCHEVHYDLGTPYLLRYPGINGPAGRPLPLKQWEAAARAVAAHPPVPGPGAEGGPAKPAPEGTPPPPAPGAGTPAPPAEGAGPASGHPEAPAEAEPPPFHPRLTQLAKTRVPIPNWRTSYPRRPTAISKEEAINELCASCHRRQVTEFRLFSHHPLFEGRVNCTDCHDPHHTRDGRMLKQASIAESCLQCHENIRGPFVFEHEPVKAGGVGRDCLECHRPHGAPNRKLEVMFSRGLCVQCHVDIQHDPAHQVRRGDCWRAGCHVAVHGSNHSFLLFRE